MTSPRRLHLAIGVVACFFYVALQIVVAAKARRGQNYYGTHIGAFLSYGHAVSGDIFVVDESTLFIKNFTYDGNAPFANFWVGNTSIPSPMGIPVPYPDHTPKDPEPLKAFSNADVLLKLPYGVKVRDIKWLSVWCRRFTVNFGSVNIPPDVHIASVRVLPEFSRLAHGLRSDNISILDSKTFYIPNLHYDGAGPDAYFWVGKGAEPDAHGTKVPNEMNSSMPLRAYEGVDIEIVLPGNLTVYDIDWLAVWCVQYRHNFGHVLIPKDLDLPPALGQTKIATSSTAPPELSNCIELLDGKVQVQWQTMGEDVQIRVTGRIRDDQYVAFGISGMEGKPEMRGSDIVVIAYNKDTNKFIADDYYISDNSQCDGEKGVCPDHRIGGKNDVVLISGKRERGVTSVTYKRPLRTNEPVLDKMIEDKETTVVAAIGLLNKKYEANAHLSSDKTNEDIRIDFGSRGVHQCPSSLYNMGEVPDVKAWPIMHIAGVDTFTMRIGPTGGQRGYSRITGEPSWGIAWWVNEMLIPEITVERGQNYTFIVEGGNDKTNPAKYHPLYITDSPEGGYFQLQTDAQRRNHKVFAGMAYDAQNYPYPTAAGRYCEYVHKTVDQSAKTETFKEFVDTLKLKCTEGEAAILEWHVEEDTPDEVYYQCYSHRNMGWKIHVVDQGYGPLKTESAAERFVPSILLILAFVVLAHLR